MWNRLGIPCMTQVFSALKIALMQTKLAPPVLEVGQNKGYWALFCCCFGDCRMLTYKKSKVRWSRWYKRKSEVRSAIEDSDARSRTGPKLFTTRNITRKSPWTWCTKWKERSFVAPVWTDEQAAAWAAARTHNSETPGRTFSVRILRDFPDPNLCNVMVMSPFAPYRPRAWQMWHQLLHT